MSSQSCLLNLFPVEIIHLIFDYLSTCDILHGFVNQSLYLDSIVFNYNFYRINFRSILKTDFDLICEQIPAKNIISLVLSDEMDTPGQSNLFFSLRKLEDFHVSLRSLTLYNLNLQSIELILNQLDQFNNLSSLTIINDTSISFETYQYHLFRFVRLKISCECFFHNLMNLPRLKYLTITNPCTFHQLNSILSYSPNLNSLNLSLEHENGIHIQQSICNLTQLIVNMTQCPMNMTYMKEFLNWFPNLKFLEIECRSDLDLCDGYEWETFLSNQIPNLKIFHFKFQLRSTIIINTNGIQNILRSYSSSYWLNEKRWFIAIEWNRRLVYSIPRYLCESADSDFRRPLNCTIKDESIFYNHINALAIWGESNDYFPNVKELWLVDDPLVINLESMINFNQIERLVFSSKLHLSIDTLFNLIKKMKNLSSIQFYHLPSSFNEYKQNVSFEQIRSIEFSREIKSISLIQILNEIFPRIQRLTMKINSFDEIEKIFQTFSSSLSIVCFHCDTSTISTTNENLFQKIFNHSNFTFSIQSNSIHFWIGSKNITEKILNQQVKEKKKRKLFQCFSWCSSKKYQIQQ
ncbi:unnamed protein product [Adineta ricciae]|uniref:F-box domain-containing protein n=1 Tax=Adineta ricciae TaxID=249248 RepID=A0A815BPP2_ADIRI|nr:unnamed protein product [Adineta ricciae]